MVSGSFCFVSSTFAWTGRKWNMKQPNSWVGGGVVSCFVLCPFLLGSDYNPCPLQMPIIFLEFQPYHFIHACFKCSCSFSGMKVFVPYGLDFHFLTLILSCFDILLCLTLWWYLGSKSNYYLWTGADAPECSIGLPFLKGADETKIRLCTKKKGVLVHIILNSNIHDSN